MIIDTEKKSLDKILIFILNFEPTKQPGGHEVLDK